MVLRRFCGTFLLALSTFSAFAQVREQETRETREEKVRDLLERFNAAYQQKDVDSLSQFVSQDLIAFAGGKNFAGWEDYRDKLLHTIFVRQMPPSTWEIEKIVTTPEMAWAFTKTMFKARRQGQQIQADLYQVFVVQKRSAQNAAKSKTTQPASPDWKIVLIDYTFEREAPPQTEQPSTEQEPLPHL
jgi:ketosteroid isomerase-like protein